MREIKFRTWWVPKKIMLKNVHLFYDTLGDKSHGNEHEPECSFGGLLEGYDKDNYIVLQYTGIKDKNGKEIYEGDTIRVRLPNIDFITNVEWDNGSFTANKGDIYRTLAHWTNDHIEIIGNIYENPESIIDV